MITSWSSFSCPTDNTVNPIRLPGTWSKYSKNAMPQLTSAATIHGLPLSSFRCAYQANVMKTLLKLNNRIVSAILLMAQDPVGRASAAREYRKSRERSYYNGYNGNGYYGQPHGYYGGGRGYYGNR